MTTKNWFDWFADISIIRSLRESLLMLKNTKAGALLCVGAAFAFIAHLSGLLMCWHNMGFIPVVRDITIGDFVNIGFTFTVKLPFGISRAWDLVLVPALLFSFAMISTSWGFNHNRDPEFADKEGALDGIGLIVIPIVMVCFAVGCIWGIPYVAVTFAAAIAALVVVVVCGSMLLAVLMWQITPPSNKCCVRTLKSRGRVS